MYDRVRILFWHPYGASIPDLTVRFSGHGLKDALILVEVKLNAGKGDSGDPELDQLIRYARVAERLATV